MRKAKQTQTASTHSYMTYGYIRLSGKMVYFVDFCIKQHSATPK